MCFANHVECQQAAAGGQQVKVEVRRRVCVHVCVCVCVCVCAGGTPTLSRQPLRQAKCIEVDPCDRAFEASLCVNDVNAKCIDATGRDPWEISCECAQLTANCLAEVNCPLDGVELETCAKTCTRDQCTATPGWRRNDIRPPGPAASATVNQLAGAALAVATALALAL